MKEVDGSTSCSFRRFQSDIYYHVVFVAEELFFWNESAHIDNTRFPALVTIHPKWEKHSILLRMPETAHPAVAARREGWEDEVEKARREAIKDLVWSVKEAGTVWWFGSGMELIPNLLIP